MDNLQAKPPSIQTHQQNALLLMISFNTPQAYYTWQTIKQAKNSTDLH